MKNKTLKSNAIFLLGTIIFVLGLLFCFIFSFRFIFFNIVMFIGILIESYGLIFMKKKITKKTKKTVHKESKEEKESVEVI